MHTCLEAGIIIMWTPSMCLQFGQKVCKMLIINVQCTDAKCKSAGNAEVLLSLPGIHTYIKFFKLPIIVPHTATIQPSKCAEFKIFPLPVVQVLSDRKYIPSSLDTHT